MANASTCRVCFEAFRDTCQRLCSGSAKSLDIDVERLGLTDGLCDIDHDCDEHLQKLAAVIESIDECRLVEDRQLLAKLISKYETSCGKIQWSCFRQFERIIEMESTESTQPTCVSYKMMPELTSSSVLDGTISQQLLRHLQTCHEEPLHPHFMATLLQMVHQLHVQRSRESGPVMHTRLPGTATNVVGGGRKPRVRRILQSCVKGREPGIVILGDTHGQLGDFLWAMANFGQPSPRTHYVVNGDIADRSKNATEIFALLFCIMLQYPSENVVVVNRGNHECMTVNTSRCGGFRAELVAKYGHTWGPQLHQLFGQVYALLPVATIIEDSVAVIHGGVGRNPENQMELLEGLPSDLRLACLNPWGIEGDPHIDALVDSLWSDPMDTPGSDENSRGSGHSWGPDYTKRFLKATGFELLVRSHQVPNDRAGTFVHDSHDGRVVTVFSASNYGGTRNKAGAVLLFRSDDGFVAGDEVVGVHSAVEDDVPAEVVPWLEFATIDLGFCPPMELIKDMPLMVAWAPGAEELGRAILHDKSFRDLRGPNSVFSADLRSELLRQARGLLVEFRSPLWEACSANDIHCDGRVPLTTWTRLCIRITRMYAVDWVLVARLVGGATKTSVEYMVTLNRFGFRIESTIVARDLAETALAQVFLRVMRDTRSLQRLVGETSQSKQRRRPRREMLAEFRKLLAKNDVAGAEADAMMCSLEAHMSSKQGKDSPVDIAEFLSAWRCASNVQADLDLTLSQIDLASKLSRLLALSASQGNQKGDGQLGGYSTPASAATLMDFFTAADRSGKGHLVVEDAVQALQKLMQAQHVLDCSDVGARELTDLLRAVNVTGNGTLNYLEFIRLFDRGGPRGLTHQGLLDALCFQVWVHRAALSSFFRLVGTDGRVTRQQLTWALESVNELVGGKLAQANIDLLVDALNWSDGSVVADEFLHAFELADLHA
eukprot:TRINITY_DN11078_c0_g1_i1.p1 TRINITY_DN11078_c0_g1~~TRINITY_DN11078_c0_g1_i1.p1  ORF type:complete len:944 (-),score=154.95 TRINITY_DN11078_c0_g1_i1:28-2859(-)